MKSILSLLAGSSLLAASTLAHAALANAEPTPLPETRAHYDQRMAWWSEARFGMFIHWGIYSQAAGYWDGKPMSGAGEWLQITHKVPTSQYSKLVQQFDPEQFDAKKWVQDAKDAGMKYIVITSKHHDGFCMWPTKLTDYSIASTPWYKKHHIDPLKQLSEACKAAGIRFCVYYSIWDLHEPDYAPRPSFHDTDKNHKPDMKKYVEYMKDQLKELITNYHPGVIWFDGEWKGWTTAEGVEVYNYIRTLDPTIIINNRINPSRGHSGLSTANERLGDYGTPERTVPVNGFAKGVYWETCQTMNADVTWGYKKQSHSFKSSETFIRQLIDVASKGGNYLLNVGPTGEGIIPQPEIDRLAAIGKWMKVNSAAIYGTSASPFPKGIPYGRATQKGNTLYLEVFDWPKDGKLVVPIKNSVTKAELLTANGGVPLTANSSENGLTVSVPATAPDAIASVVAITLNGNAEPIENGAAASAK